MHIVLVEPEIAPNTGSIARLCAATGSTLHLVEPLGFVIDDKHLRRAGLDYWPFVDVRRHCAWGAFTSARSESGLVFFSARAERSYTNYRYDLDDSLVFGCESKGLSREIRDRYPDRFYSIPMIEPHVRSLNLANAVAIVLYEALRQLGNV